MLFNRMERFCTQNMFHSARIFYRFLWVNAQVNQPVGKQGMSFIHGFCNFSALRSQVQVSRIEKKALEKLREAMEQKE